MRATWTQNGTLSEYDYEPFGKLIPSLATGGDRTTYIDKEKDKESGLGDFGVRKHSEKDGRFLSVDPMWEKYSAWTPYQYSLCNPMSLVDRDGREVLFSSAEDERQFNEALTYLLQNKVAGAMRVLHMLMTKSYAVNLRIDNSISGGVANNEFKPQHGNTEMPGRPEQHFVGTLYWASTAALAYKNELGIWEKRSPAIGLLHESWHVILHAEYDAESSRYESLGDQMGHTRTYDAFRNEAEGFIINQIENPAIIQTGEGKFGRTCWDCPRGSVYNYRVSGPTSTKRVPDGEEK